MAYVFGSAVLSHQMDWQSILSEVGIALQAVRGRPDHWSCGPAGTSITTIEGTSSIDPTSPKRHSDKTTARHGKCYRVRDGSSFDADLCSVSEGDSPNLLR